MPVVSRVFERHHRRTPASSECAGRSKGNALRPANESVVRRPSTSHLPPSATSPLLTPRGRDPPHHRRRSLYPQQCASASRSCSAPSASTCPSSGPCSPASREVRALRRRLRSPHRPAGHRHRLPPPKLPRRRHRQAHADGRRSPGRQGEGLGTRLVVGARAAATSVNSVSSSSSATPATPHTASTPALAGTSTPTSSMRQAFLTAAWSFRTPGPRNDPSPPAGNGVANPDLRGIISQMDPAGIRQLFADHDLRWTKQREEVYTALAASKAHPTAEELFNQVQSAAPRPRRGRIEPRHGVQHPRCPCAMRPGPPLQRPRHRPRRGRHARMARARAVPIGTMPTSSITPT